jgi:hypothetical protein
MLASTGGANFAQAVSISQPPRRATSVEIITRHVSSDVSATTAAVPAGIIQFGIIDAPSSECGLSRLRGAFSVTVTFNAATACLMYGVDVRRCRKCTLCRGGGNYFGQCPKITTRVYFRCWANWETLRMLSPK